MKRHNANRIALGVLVLLMATTLAGCGLWTVRPLDADGKVASTDSSQKPFDPVAYVDSVWDSKVLPAFQSQATDLSTVLAGLKDNAQATQEKYGHHDGNSPYSFMVKVQAKVVSVDTTSRAGKAGLDLAPFDGKADVTLQIGPVLMGNAVRDSVGFIQFNQFVNQIQFADVAGALNNRVLKTVLNGLDPASLQGKTITVLGAFTQDGDNIVITPVKLEVGGQG